MKKTVLAGIILLFSTISQAEETLLSLFDFSGGLITNYSPERIPINSTPDCQNVRFSKDIGLVMREGSLPFLTSPLTELQSVRSMFEYIQSDGDKYLIFNSSWSCYNALSNGVSASIVGGLNPAYTDSYTTAMNSLYRDNGDPAGTPGKWNGATYTPLTVANSTSVPKGMFNYWYNNVLLKAGIANDRSRFYWSVTLSPDDFGSTGYGWKYVGKDDGDNITGGIKAGDSFIWTKEHSTWQLIGKNVASWLLTCISPDIGCLYASTMDIYQGMPIWLSHRGVVVYDGSRFNLISEPIDNEIKALRQLDTNQTVTTLTTAADWGAGSGTNIDTTTYLGSVVIGTQTIINTLSYYVNPPNLNNLVYSLSTLRASQKVIANKANEGINSVQFYVYRTANGTGNFMVGVIDSNNTILSATQYPTSSIPIDTYTLFTSTFTEVSLIQNSTYYVFISSGASFSMPNDTTQQKFGIVLYGRVSGEIEPYSNGRLDYYNGSWTAWGNGADCVCNINFTSKASYTTQSLNAGSSWGTWGNFVVDDTLPSGSAINYYAVTSTSTYNLTTNTAFAVADNSPINSSVGPYIKIVSSFTRTDATAIPKINQIDIQSYGTNSFYPVGRVFNDEYWLFVSTNNSTQYNDTVYVYDRYGRWTKYSGIYAQSACTFRNNFYTGNSNSNGKIYRQQVPNVYTDDSIDYCAYYTTPPLDAGNPSAQKIWNKIYIQAENSGGSMGLDYRVDGYTTDFTTTTISLSGSGLLVHKTPIPDQLKSYYLQLKLKSISGKFNVRGLNLIYDPQPIQ